MKFLLHTIFIVFSMALFAQQTYVPDDNFEQALIDLGYDDVLDDYVLTDNINTVTELILSYKNISDMTGIQDFDALVHLESNGNQHNSLDISQNSSLTYLDCSGSEVDELFLNSALITLYCSSNQLNEIDISNCINLEFLHVSSNLLSEIDISNNINLKRFNCHLNSINSLNLENNIQISELYCSNNNLTYLNLSENEQLNKLNCNDNYLTELDLSNNVAINELIAFNNQINYLDLINNVNLYSLDLDENIIIGIELSTNPLFILLLRSNELEWIDIRNGYNDNMLNFDATNNPGLHCVFVDDTDFLYPNNWHVDDNSVFMESEAECDLAVGNEKIKNLKIYPNPVENIFYVQSDKEIHELILYTTQGQVVKHFNTSENFSIGDLKSGVYFLKILSNDSQRIESVIKK